VSRTSILELKLLVSAIAVAVLAGCGSASPVAPTAVRPIVQQQRALTSDSGLDYKSVIEALFFGTGPLARTDSPGCDNTLQRMRGWARGSHVHVVAYGSIDTERRAAVQRTLVQANQVFSGLLTTDYATRDDAIEPAGSPDGEIAVFGAPAVRVPALCGSNAANCQVVRYSNGVYIGSRVILSMPYGVTASGVVAHEIGHAFGLCHIDPTRAGLDSALSVMGNSNAGQWTPVDLDAIRLVYGAGLSPGDPRDRFVAAGLIN
jgi:hypothetical protein